ncbi:MAG: sensor histidine kinase [Ferruginibacter sp.]
MKSPAVIITITGIAIFFITPLVFITSQSGFASTGQLLFSWQYWLFVVYFLAIYLLLRKLLFPLLYIKRKFFLFYAALLLIMISAFYLKPFDRLMHFRRQNNFPARQEVFPGKPPGPPAQNTVQAFSPGWKRRGPFPIFDIVSIFLTLMVFLLAVSAEAIQRWRSTEERAIQAEADKANAELTFLKAQINPHFLFNTLNNIYSLAVTKNENTADAVMKLSNIMRYVTDEANETMVPLQQEIDCIKNYISLQQLRLGENVKVDFTVGGDLINQVIPPLSLMTFVENAFKHGISNHEQSSVMIKIDTDEKGIHFFEQNKLFAKPRNTERTGIGIENTKQRLLRLYQQQYSLVIKQENGLYTVDLFLNS